MPRSKTTTNEQDSWRFEETESKSLETRVLCTLRGPRALMCYAVLVTAVWDDNNEPFPAQVF